MFKQLSQLNYYLLKKRHLLVYVLFILTTFTTFAQSNNGSVTGKLTDPLTGEMIDFAGVAILNQGTEDVVKSGTSNNGGIFKFTNMPYGRYTVRISFVGYEKQTDASHLQPIERQTH